MGKINNNNKMRSKGKHAKKENISEASKKRVAKIKKAKHLSNFATILLAIVLTSLIVGIIVLGIYFFKPEKVDVILDMKEVGVFNNELINKSNNAKSSNIISNNGQSLTKFVTKKYKGKEYNIATGFFEREYDIIYFSYLEDMKKVNKMSQDTIFSYDEYVQYCKNNNIKQKFKDKDKRYSLFTNFKEGYEDIKVFVCDRIVEESTEIFYLSKEYSNPNPNSIAGFVLIFPSSQTNTTNTAIRDVISESDYSDIVGERFEVTNTPINKDVLYQKNIVITDNEKVNYVLNKMLDNVSHKNTISYSYTYDVPEYEKVNAILDLNTCTQYVEKNNKPKYTIYGDYEAVDFDNTGYIGNNWFYKDEIIKKFLNLESLSYTDFFDFVLDEDENYYIVKAYVKKQNNVIEGKVSREEEFFYIEKETFELKKMYCHNFINHYDIVFNYSNEPINIPEGLI